MLISKTELTLIAVSKWQRHYLKFFFCFKLCSKVTGNMHFDSYPKTPFRGNLTFQWNNCNCLHFVQPSHPLSMDSTRTFNQMKSFCLYTIDNKETFSLVESFISTAIVLRIFFENCRKMNLQHSITPFIIALIW